MTELFRAVTAGLVAGLRGRIKAGNDLNERGVKGMTALMHAAKSDRLKTQLRILIAAGAKLDIQDEDGKTALMHAAPAAPRVVQSLIQAGAAIDLLDNRGYSATAMAAPESLRQLIAAGAQPNQFEKIPLIACLKQRNIPLAITLLERGAQLEFPDQKTFDRCRETLERIADSKSELLRPAVNGAPANVAEFIESIVARGSAKEVEASDEDLPEILRPGRWPVQGSKGDSVTHDVPEVPHFWSVDMSPRPRLRESRKVLPDHAIRTMVRMVLMSRHDAPIPELREIEATCERRSLVAFAWSLFEEWNHNGKSDTDGLLQVIGYWGDDECARRLTRYIREWPARSLFLRSRLGIDVLTTLGTDVALAQVHAISQKNKYASAKKYAEERKQALADARGLTAGQLEDRLVPTLGLDSDGMLKLDLGSHCLIGRVDERLRPLLMDESGAILDKFPSAGRPNGQGSICSAAAIWDDFRKALKSEARTQLERLELAMLKGRTWSGEDFRRFLVAHPLLRRPVRGLIWAVVSKNGRLKRIFEVSQEGAFLDVNGAPIAVADTDTVGIPHPLLLGDAAAAWSRLFASRRQGQPFPQLARKVFRREADVRKDIFGLNGAIVPLKALRGLKAAGWHPAIEFADMITFYEKNGTRVSTQEGYCGHITGMSDGDLASEQVLTVDISDALKAVDYSEVVRELQRLRK